MPRKIAETVLQIEADAIRALLARLDERFDRAVEAIAGCGGRVITTGMGKAGIIARKIAATLASTGTPSHFLHPAEAVHGDLGVVLPGDVVLAVSNSGETAEILGFLEVLKRTGVTLVSLTGNADSTLARHSDIVLDVSIEREACPLGLAPTASTTAALAMGDALAMAVLETRGFTEDDFARRHPGGRLGKRLLKARDVMHSGERLPRVAPETPLRDALREMTARRLGMTTVTGPDGRLLGILTDGDVRRFLERAEGDPLSRPASEAATPSPQCVGPEVLATECLKRLEERKITSLCVVDGEGRVLGVVHLHDLWRTNLL